MVWPLHHPNLCRSRASLQPCHSSVPQQLGTSSAPTQQPSNKWSSADQQLNTSSNSSDDRRRLGRSYQVEGVNFNQLKEESWLIVINNDILYVAATVLLLESCMWFVYQQVVTILKGIGFIDRHFVKKLSMHICTLCRTLMHQSTYVVGLSLWVYRHFIQRMISMDVGSMAIATTKRWQMQTLKDGKMENHLK